MPGYSKLFPIKLSSPMKLRTNFKSVVVTGIALAAPALSPLMAANVILNGGFEDPVVGAAGNNFPPSVPNWTVIVNPGSAPCGSGHNIVLTGPPYDGGPDVAVDGTQYYDICGAAGYLMQGFTVGSPSMITFGASFSRRDADTGGGSTDIFDSTNNTLLFSSPLVLVDASESQEIWRLSSATIPQLPAGSYVMRVNILDPANADAVFVDVTPVPEPGTTLLLAGTLAASLRRRRR